MATKLDQLYSLRKKFTIIGITGRTGSGCTEVSELLSKPFCELDNIRVPKGDAKSVFDKKYLIVYNYTSQNWQKYNVVQYKRVILFILLPFLYKEKAKALELIKDYYRFRMKDEPTTELIQKVDEEITAILNSFNSVVLKIIHINVKLIKSKNDAILKKLYDIFWGEDFFKLSHSIDECLIKNGLINRICLLHHIACNFRKSGQPFKTKEKSPEYIYFICNIINLIIKATKRHCDSGCHIVIDSLRNSLEINFFKERYSAFYLIAVKNDKRKTRLKKLYNSHSELVINRILEIDDKEYLCGDFQKGNFDAPDVQNCIQMAGFHINNYNFSEEKDQGYISSFHSLGEQLIKLQGLIQQPGLITPDAQERIMQIAFTSKLNSGCISRQVGAVVTDKEFSVKSVGWNDVPKGATPCSVRNIKDLQYPETASGYTEFELGRGLKETEQINGNQTDKQSSDELDKESIDFLSFVQKAYSEQAMPMEKLGGRNCPYCFKQAYNAFSGEKNQVHTRSLHAEENAMLQISKNGGEGLEGGFLFTTASPCELCAKKAYQLGIKYIYFIDPYPGISRNHILKSNPNHDPKMISFSGAVGRDYHKLYDPFMSQKDELSLLTDFKIESPEDVKVKQLKSLLKTKIVDNELKGKLDELFEGHNNPLERFIEILKNGLNGQKNMP
ncbi:Cytidine and deoxycytidylate deaminase zinc-binding region [Arachidicoccus rhizosphaerae]|uniref:Cytidine and deoxycytidylate deaminase zinc-binding region n=1 Tax=Arachidicoccus rhizosphaerae TaxID=551991 RepID=A0A1H3YRU3_9BACT|nr:hypothetical protein [Arachidicoccus rhizosphaerae]SEA14170.1 Cytidine and deoxycytidylate deaminase zinc-binding region [Arachidicoccus rhizosphaerae]